MKTSRHATGGWAVVLGLVLVAFGITGAPRDSSPSTRAADPSGLQVPAGFRITVFADGLRAPRVMALDPRGTLLVSIPIEGRIVALPDPTGQGKAGTAVTVVANLNLPHGLAFRARHLYVAEEGRVLRFQYDPATYAARDPVVVIPELPPGIYHWSRTIAFGPDGCSTWRPGRPATSVAKPTPISDDHAGVVHRIVSDTP